MKQVRDHKYPGPGTYKAANTKSRIRWSMRMRITNNFAEKQARQLPGPGEYKLPGIHKDGEYCLSNNKNSLVRRIGKDKRRSMARKTCAPGPG